MADSDSQDLRWEQRIADVYRGVTVPVEEIWRVAVTRSSSAGRRSRRRLGQDTAFALAIAVVAAGVVGLAIAVHLSRAPASVAPRPITGSASGVPAVSCTLPIAILSAASDASDGFLRVETGTYAAAPQAHGEGYARALGQWVPVTARYVAPDGASYVYVMTNLSGSALQFVDRTGDRLVFATAGPVQVLGFVSRQSVAYTAPDTGGRLSTWSLDTTTLRTKVVSRDHLYSWAGGGALWRTGAAAQGSGLAFYRLDLGTGAETVWFDVDGYLGAEPAQSPSLNSEGTTQTLQDFLHRSVGILGFDDSGHPLVQLGSGGVGSFSAAVLVTGQDVVQTLVSPGPNTQTHLVPTSAAGGSQSTLWMVDAGGHVALYRGSGRPQVIASLQVPSGGKAELAGPCR